ncbi:unnamed protein product [Penicillium pancosmium]
MPRKSTLYLPPEVVEIIAGYLAFEHPPTLLEFAKASRTYYASSQPAIKSIKFHDIKLQVSASKEQFQIVVNHLIEQLKAKDGLPYVRKLIIIGQRSTDNPYEWKTPQMSELRCNGPGDTYTTQFGEYIERFGAERDTYYFDAVSGMNPEHCAYESMTLVIHGGLNDEAFKVWDKMGFLFSSLKTLYLNLAGSHPLEFYDDANKFLQRLPPLTELKLEGWHSRIGIESLLGVHGSHLRKLRLIKPEAWQTLSGHQIRQISQKCPLLADLEVKIDGTQSHANKNEIYAALGSIRNLKYLDLTYEVHFVGLPTIPREEIVRRRDIPKYQELSSHSSFGKFENQVCEEASEWLPNYRLRNGHLRKIIVDSVMDERLVCEVFQVIYDTKTQSLSLFEDLTIKIRGADFDDTRLKYLVDTFSSDWHVIRDTDFRRRGTLIAKEIEPGSDRIGGRYIHLPQWMEPIFYELFPAAKPKGQQRKVSKKLSAKRAKEKNQSIPTWRRYLHSFPATSATDD